MASIRKRKKQDGSISYMAQIVIKRQGVIVHRESRTFMKAVLAKTWAAKRELELQEQDVFDKKEVLTIGSIIQEYLDNFPVGRSKGNDMKRLLKYDIAKIDAHKLTSSDIIKHCAMRNKEAKPQTVKNDVIWLKVALSTIKGVHDYSYSLDMFVAANAVMRQEGLIASADKRDRLPARNELWQLSRYFYNKKAPYLHIMWFSIYSARRLSETCSLEWKDINHDKRLYLIRDMKTPGKKELNLWAKIPRGAYKIIMKQPQSNSKVFPYKPKTVSSSFTRACKILGIDNLHFHDLRHEAVSRFFKRGLTIQEVQKVSLHQSWSSLAIYTNLAPEDVDV